MIRQPWNKGKHLSKEHREKISNANLGEKNSFYGKHHSEATKRKIGDALLRRKSPMLGKHHSEATKRKIGDALLRREPSMLGKYHTDATKQKLRDARIGMKLSTETKEKISQKNLGHIPWNKGGHHTEKTKERMRNSHLGTHSSETTKQKITISRLGEKNPMWGRRGEKHFRYGKKLSIEQKQKIGGHSKMRWSNEDYAKKMFKAFRITPNKKELLLFFFLQKYFPEEWQYVGDGKLFITGYCPDFIRTDGAKQIIELFGDYWHNQKKNIRYSHTETGRKEIFAKSGFSTLIIWEHELKNEKLLLEKITEFKDKDRLDGRICR